MVTGRGRDQTALYTRGTEKAALAHAIRKVKWMRVVYYQ